MDCHRIRPRSGSGAALGDACEPGRLGCTLRAGLIVIVSLDAPREGFLGAGCRVLAITGDTTRGGSAAPESQVGRIRDTEIVIPYVARDAQAVDVGLVACGDRFKTHRNITDANCFVSGKKR